MQDITVKQVQDIILEAQADKTLRNMFIHKSPCAGNSVGAVFFAISGTPPRGYAMFLPEGGVDTGTLHVFDHLGLKRKILHCKITDLVSYRDNDVWDVQAAHVAVEAR
jgi:hypothetical protein